MPPQKTSSQVPFFHAEFQKANQIQSLSLSCASSSPCLKMGPKHLHELLGEDQEPFLLNSYIADRSFLFRRKPPVKSQLQLKKQGHAASQNSIFSGNVRKGSCFFSLPDSPDPRKSPLCFDLRSPKRTNSVFLHVPARTAALLLEAALRIQSNSSQNKPTKPSIGLPGFRLFGSLLKRLTNRNWTERAKQRIETSGCACNGGDGGRHCSSSMVEAESSSDFEEEEGNVGFDSKAIYGEETCVFCDEEFCESPFRFALQTSPPSGHRTPEMTSPPASSPIRRDLKVCQHHFFQKF